MFRWSSIVLGVNTRESQKVLWDGSQVSRTGSLGMHCSSFYILDGGTSDHVNTGVASTHMWFI